MKRRQTILIILLVLFSSLWTMAQNQGSKGKKITTIVIDAGHGGRDPGAVGKHAKEKDITLKTALKVGHYIKTNLPDVKVIYTRTKDVFVELKKRGEIANKNNADLFISIHCNANNSRSLYGAETYVLGSDENRINRNMKVAMLENAAILLEENAEDTYNGFDPGSPESYIIFSLKQNDYKQQQSLLLAQKIQSQFKNRAGRRDRGVHQAGFLVLAGTYMPSVLVELGYLSNPVEEKYLMSEKGQVYLASAIYRAVKEYKKEFELENKSVTSSSKATVKKKTVTKPESAAKPVFKGIEYRVQFYTSPQKISLSDSRFSGVPEVSVYFHNGLYKYTSGHFKTLNEAVTRQQQLKRKGYLSAWVVKMKDGRRSSKTTTVSKEDPVEYRIQFYTSPRKIPLSDSRFKNIKEISYYYHNGLYKYTSGHYNSLQEAKTGLSAFNKLGYRDSFIVKMQGNRRLP